MYMCVRLYGKRIHSKCAYTNFGNGNLLYNFLDSMNSLCFRFQMLQIERNFIICHPNRIMYYQNVPAFVPRTIFFIYSTKFSYHFKFGFGDFTIYPVCGMCHFGVAFFFFCTVERVFGSIDRQNIKALFRCLFSEA